MKATFALLGAVALAAPAVAKQAKPPMGHFGSEWSTKTASFRAQMGVNVGQEDGPLDPAIYRDVAFDWRTSKTNTGPYPAAAFAKRQEGEVMVDLSISETGALKACSITKASGVPSVDAHVCPHLLKTARFVPRMDRAGTSLAVTTPARISYEVTLKFYQVAPFNGVAEQPLRASPMAPITITTLGMTAPPPNAKGDQAIPYRLAVDASGTPTACLIRQTTGSNAIDKQVCDGLLANARFKPATRKDGTAAASEYWGYVSWP